MTGRYIFSMFRPLIILISLFLSLLPMSIKFLIFQVFSGFPTKIGALIRYILLKSMIKNIGDNIYIGRWCIFKNIQALEIGNNVSLHDMCYIDALGGIIIKDNVSIAHQSSLISFEHSYSDSNLNIKYQPLIKKNILINHNVWIGCGCRILAGTEILPHTIIGANSVTKGIIESGLNAGIPAKKIKDIK